MRYEDGIRLFGFERTGSSKGFGKFVPGPPESAYVRYSTSFPQYRVLTDEEEDAVEKIVNDKMKALRSTPYRYERGADSDEKTKLFIEAEPDWDKIMNMKRTIGAQSDDEHTQ